MAKAACMSRSAFAERFTGFAGMPPMRYLSHWRLQLAAVRLGESPRATARIAREVGYESESAFSRTFKQDFGITPGRGRRYTSSNEPTD